MTVTNNNDNIALLGGTFDPVHFGHLAIAEHVIKQLNFSKVIFIPNRIPPHRDAPAANEQHRLNMLKLAISHNHKFKINRCELDRKGPSFMHDTIEQICTELDIKNDSKRKIWLILGQDAFNKLASWYKFKQLVQLCGFIVINRLDNNNNSPNTSLDNILINKHNINIQYLNIDPINISGTNIRNILKRGLSSDQTQQILKKSLPTKVINYIKDNNLYS